MTAAVPDEKVRHAAAANGLDNLVRDE